MSEKRDEIEKIVNEIYCDLDLDDQEDWDRVSEIIYRAFPNPAAVQSAEEFCHRLSECPAIDVKIEMIKQRDAAQRQAGREEMLKECVELLNAHHKGLDSNGDQIYRIPIKALSDLGKARKG